MTLKYDGGEFRVINTGLDPETVNPRTTPRSEFNAAYETIRRVTGAHTDLKALFEELLRDDGYKPAKWVTGRMPQCPELIEVSVWDNWLGEKSVKGQPQRFGVNIKAWTRHDVNFRAADQVDWTGRVSLMTPDNLRKASAKAQKTAVSSKGEVKGNTYPISPEYAAMIEDACIMMEGEGWSGGMLVSKPFGEGTLRHDRQMMVADTAGILARDVNATAIIWVDHETPILLPTWDTCDASGKPLPESFDPKTGKHAICVLQSRYARNPDHFAGWISGRA